MAIIVSACLVGVNSRYDGTSCLNEELLTKLNAKLKSAASPEMFLIPLCPEQLGGLPTPREPAQIKGGDGHDVLRGRASVVTSKGDDVTQNFTKGAEEVMKIARMFDARVAYLKSKSPSCGCGQIFRDGRLAPGNGVCAAMLIDDGIEVVRV